MVCVSDTPTPLSCRGRAGVGATARLKCGYDNNFN
jgi:hypothetical protein